MTDCRRCAFSEPSALGMGQLNCRAGAVPVPTNYARSSHGDCRAEAAQFVPLPGRPEPIRGGQE